MSQALLVQSELELLKEQCYEFILSLETQFEEYQSIPRQKIEFYLDKYKNKLEEWDKLLQKASHFVKVLPKEVMQRDLIKNFGEELKKYDTQLKQQIQSIDLSQILAKTDKIAATINSLKVEAQSLFKKIGQIEENYIIQKLIEGQKILASKKQLQWKRKFFHCANGLFGLCFYAYWGIPEWISLLILSSYFSFTILVEILRRAYPSFNTWIYKSIAGIMREEEKNKISSATWFVGALTFVLVFFPKPVVIITLLAVTIGDTAAGIIGTKYGKHKIFNNASLEGFAAFVLSTSAITYILSHFGLIEGISFTGLKLLSFSLLAGLIGAFSESCFKKLDDNLTIPLFSAPAIYVLIILFNSY